MNVDYTSIMMLTIIVVVEILIAVCTIPRPKLRRTPEGKESPVKFKADLGVRTRITYTVVAAGWLLGVIIMTLIAVLTLTH